MNTNLLKELVKTRKILKRKFQSIKLGEEETLQDLRRTFDPVTQPINKILKLSKDKIKQSNAKAENTDFNEENKKLKTKLDNGKEDIDDAIEDGNDGEEEEEFFSQSEDEDGVDLSKLHRDKKLDTVFGPHKDSNGVWKFGDSIIDINEDKIIVGNHSWAYTPGLFQLLFYKKPHNYDALELDIYKKILIDTNAHKRNYNPNERIKGNKGYKYKNIIQKLFDTTYIGKGLMTTISEKSNYIYWDDPNELVDRLKLLIASKQAGHTNQNNEIISIIEELKEADIIY